MCGDLKLYHSTMSCWFQRFCHGHDSTEDKEHSGRPRTSTDNTLETIITSILEEEICMTCEEIGVESGIQKLSIQYVLT